jgi:hypothetical protein
MMGPMAQNPLQPVSTTLISSESFLCSNSATKAFFTSMLPDA